MNVDAQAITQLRQRRVGPLLDQLTQPALTFDIQLGLASTARSDRFQRPALAQVLANAANAGATRAQGVGDPFGLPPLRVEFDDSFADP